MAKLTSKTKVYVNGQKVNVDELVDSTRAQAEQALEQATREIDRVLENLPSIPNYFPLSAPLSKPTQRPEGKDIDMGHMPGAPPKPPKSKQQLCKNCKFIEPRKNASSEHYELTLALCGYSDFCDPIGNKQYCTTIRQDYKKKCPGYTPIESMKHRQTAPTMVAHVEQPKDKPVIIHVLDWVKKHWVGVLIFCFLFQSCVVVGSNCGEEEETEQENKSAEVDKQPTPKVEKSTKTKPQTDDWGDQGDF
jgi:hypothetical protein